MYKKYKQNVLGNGIYKKIKYLFNCFLDILFPLPLCCSLCGRQLKEITKLYMCNNCLLKLKRNPKVVITRDEFLTHNRVISDTIKPEFDLVILPCLYEGYARDLVHALKYKDKRAVAYTIAGFIAGIVKQEGINVDLITYVPINRKRLRMRGYNQCQLIAKELSSILEVQVEDLLIRTLNTKSQVLFNGSMRWYNVKDAFRCEKHLEGKSILLIDDVVTTGATMHYCGKALKSSGAGSIYAAAFAGGDYSD